MDYGLPNVNIKHFSKIEPYDGDFSTLFVVFSENVSFPEPILLTRKHHFDMIAELSEDAFLKRAVHSYFANGGERLYLLFPSLGHNNRFDDFIFNDFLIKECDRLNDIEVITAVNLFDIEIYNTLLSMQEIIQIQRIINNYCASSHRISLTDMNADFDKESLNIIGKTVIYYPWMLDSSNQPLPPSVYASALFSKMAREDKYFESIANKALVNTVDVELRLDDTELKALVSDFINPVIFIPHRGVRIWGVKSFDEKIDIVNELRVLKFIKRRLIKMSKVYLFEPNTIFLEAQIILMVKVFLEQLENKGALVYQNVERDSISLQQGNEIIINIDVAFATPIEFINIRLNKVDKDGMINLI